MLPRVTFFINLTNEVSRFDQRVDAATEILAKIGLPSTVAYPEPAGLEVTVIEIVS